MTEFHKRSPLYLYCFYNGFLKQNTIIFQLLSTGLKNCDSISEANKSDELPNRYTSRHCQYRDFSVSFQDVKVSKCGSNDTSY